MFEFMEAPLKIYALLASVSCTQLLTSWVGNRLLTYVKASSSPSSNPPPFKYSYLPNWLTVYIPLLPYRIKSLNLNTLFLLAHSRNAAPISYWYNLPASYWSSLSLLFSHSLSL